MAITNRLQNRIERGLGNDSYICEAAVSRTGAWSAGEAAPLRTALNLFEAYISDAYNLDPAGITTFAQTQQMVDELFLRISAAYPAQVVVSVTFYWQLAGGVEVVGLAKQG